MKYIIMCGGKYHEIKEFRPLIKINNESLVERTIRLLKELCVEDIAVSTGLDIDLLDFLDVPIIKFKNTYNLTSYNNGTGYWCDAFYYTDEPVCYLMGDVFYSKAALKTIIDTPVNKIGFFGTDKPFAKGYFKNYEEPLAFKVEDQELLHAACDMFRYYQDLGRDKWPFCRLPMSWELACIICNYPLNKIVVKTPIFIGVHDFADDVDKVEEAVALEKVVKEYNIE